MEHAIQNFPEQFNFQPVVVGNVHMSEIKRVVVCGMGGSHQAADLLAIRYPERLITTHSDYGLPYIPSEDEVHTLIIASSYSGNTEEALDAYDEAKRRGLPLAAIAVGGELIRRAAEDGVPHVVLPNVGIQPRAGLGYSLRGLLALLGDEAGLAETAELARTLDVVAARTEGETLAATMQGRVPVIYASNTNRAVANIWKIKFNENAKIPAFMNVLPELNHNEMTGFDVAPAVASLKEPFHVVFLSDDTDRPKIRRRLEVCKSLYDERGVKTSIVPITGATFWHRIFSSLLIADWASWRYGTDSGAETEQVPMVETFKKQIDS